MLGIGMMAVSILSTENGKDYILGGEDVEKNAYPWQGEISINIISHQSKSFIVIPCNLL